LPRGPDIVAEVHCVVVLHKITSRQGAGYVLKNRFRVRHLHAP
jgi:hypothetical protein